MAVIQANFNIVYNRDEAWEQEYELAAQYYAWACSLPIYGEGSAERWLDARDRLNRARHRVAYGF